MRSNRHESILVTMGLKRTRARRSGSARPSAGNRAPRVRPSRPSTTPSVAARATTRPRKRPSARPPTTTPPSSARAERSAPGLAATHERKTFEQFYGTNKNGKNAYGKCVSTKAEQQKAGMDSEDQQAIHEFKNAAKECAAERDEIGVERFAVEYGTNHNKRNAFAKCMARKTQGSGR